MVGFNRRFAQATRAAIAHLADTQGPRQVAMRVNAGAIPRDHWTQDPAIGGGRLLGEGCHFVDLAVALTGSLVKSVVACAIPLANRPTATWDDFSIVLTMEDGSVATIAYTSIGDKGLPKERIEMFGGGKAVVIDDFVSVALWHGGRRKRQTSKGQDKGQREEINAWAKSLLQGKSAIPFDEICNVHHACLAAVRSIQKSAVVHL
jgi:polar amino acid transport system substrate-binding protein